ncbi:hypothetical protein ABFV99_14095 [Cytobacillus horneckiae]|uniref:hypothetical protein n=1 Tax=Cytobacillus horneckiae TaxID=549687 RepID=UPI0034CEF94F
MNKNINELYRTFALAIQQNTEALEKGFIIALQQESKVVDALPVAPALTPMKPTDSIVEDSIPDTNYPNLISGNKVYRLQIRFDKPCESCPFASNCELKKSHINTNCNVSQMKNAAVEAGELHIKVSVNEETMKSSFNIYKDGIKIGLLAEQKENKPLRTALEAYMGKTVRVSTQLQKELPHSVYTALHAEIVGVVEEKVPEVYIDETIVFPEPILFPTPMIEPLTDQDETATIELGEMVLPYI